MSLIEVGVGTYQQNVGTERKVLLQCSICGVVSRRTVAGSVDYMKVLDI